MLKLNLKNSVLYVLILLGGSGCQDKVNKIVNDVFDDRDYSGEINWPDVSNSACPQWRDGDTVVVQQSTTLPANCLFNRVTVKIDASDVDFDCNGAVFNGLPEGVRTRRSYFDDYKTAQAPRDVAFIIEGAETRAQLRNVTLRNCQIINYVDNVDVNFLLKQSTKDSLLASSAEEGRLRTISPQNVRILDSKLLDAHKHGVYVNRYVTQFGVTDSSIKGSGNSGIYLESGTQGATITGTVLEGNGFSSYDTVKLVRNPRQTDESRREAIAVDSSSSNLFQGNTFVENAFGGIFFYKNCWEHAADNPNQLPRYSGADDNQVSGNEFKNEKVAVWVAERADRDLATFNCGDPLVYEENGEKYYRDYAQGNTISGNTFTNSRNAVYVMDNDTTVESNQFSGTEGYDIEVGSRIRQLIGDPVSSTVVRGNSLSRSGAVRFIYGAN